MDTLERVREIVADITQNTLEETTENSSVKNLDGWDAVSQVSIIAAIEMDFGILFQEDAESLNSIRKIVHALKVHEAAA